MRSNHEKSKAAYNKMAESYDTGLEGRFTQPFKEHLLRIIDLHEGDTVLDVACGTGSLLHMLAGKAKINGFGVDISDEMVKIAAQTCPTMTFKAAGCERIPLESNQFDIMTVCCAYHHFPDVKAFAGEVQRLLKPNGKLYIAEVYLNPILKTLLNPFVPLMPEGDVRFYSAKEIIRNFEPYQFKSIAVSIAENRQIVCMSRSV